MLLERIRTSIRRSRNRRSWDKRWREPGFNPPWLADTPRPFVLTGLKDGWLAPGMNILEIGCGRGNTAIWLANQKLNVLAIDVSEHAIRQAQKRHPTQDGLAFEVVDFCGPISFKFTFDVILDTGCLQHLALDLQNRYQENILRASHPGSRFIVTMCTGNVPADARRLEVEELFGQSFKLVHTEEVPPASRTAYSHLNAVFHFIRR